MVQGCVKWLGGGEAITLGSEKTRDRKSEVTPSTGSGTGDRLESWKAIKLEGGEAGK
jgi:hypothetical protein